MCSSGHKLCANCGAQHSASYRGARPFRFTRKLPQHRLRTAYPGRRLKSLWGPETGHQPLTPIVALQQGLPPPMDLGVCAWARVQPRGYPSIRPRVRSGVMSCPEQGALHPQSLGGTLGPPPLTSVKRNITSYRGYCLCDTQWLNSYKLCVLNNLKTKELLCSEYALWLHLLNFGDDLSYANCFPTQLWNQIWKIAWNCCCPRLLAAYI